MIVTKPGALIDNDLAIMAGLYVTTPADTVISSSGEYVKMLGTTAVTNASDEMTIGQNRITYAGWMPRHFHVVCQASVTFVAGNNQTAGLAVYHYDNSASSGAILAHSEVKATIGANDLFQITTHADVMLNTGDYIEMHLANHTTTQNMNAALAYLFGMGVVMDG